MPVADPIAALLAGTWPDPDTGELVRAESRAVVIEDSLDGAEVSLVEGLGLGPRLALICDPDTGAALGHRVGRALGARYAVETIELPRAPHADAETLARLIERVPPTDAIVAVGSGTINDLGKLVARARGVPQVVFATAPSMNGYTSVSASILEGGVKRSVRAATPLGVFFDLGVLARAPARLVRAGLGDSLCRSTAQVDWRLAHGLLDRPYREAPFALLAGDEAALFAEPAALVAGDVRAMRHLVRTLVLSGFGMTIAGGSYPASQGEHLIAHWVTMMGESHALHGEEIAVCTLAMAALQARWIDRDEPPRLHASTITREEILARYGEAGETCWRELEPKLLDDRRAEELNARLAQTWGQLRARLAEVAVPAARLRAILEAAGAPTEPEAIGWPRAMFDDARAHAREIRDRYTFLDLDADAS